METRKIGYWKNLVELCNHLTQFECILCSHCTHQGLLLNSDYSQLFHPLIDNLLDSLKSFRHKTVAKINT